MSVHAQQPSTMSGQGTPRLWRRRTGLGLQWLAVGLAVILVLLTLGAAGYDAASQHIVPVPPPDAHGHSVQTGVVLTRYEQWGRHGPVLVLVPGFIESSFVWRQVGPILGAHFRVYAPDVRGFGYTTHLGPYTLGADTRQLAAFLAALHLDTQHHNAPVLIGHSSGAAIIANVARLHPHAVRGIVMVDGDGTSAGAGPDWMHKLIVDPYFTAALRLTLHHPVVMQSIWSSVCGPRCPPLKDAELDGWRRPLEVPGAESALKTIVRAPIIGLSPTQLETIRVPAGVLRGAGDPELTENAAQSVAQWIRARANISIPRARHLPMISDPHAFVADLASVVRLLSNRSRSLAG